MQSVSSWWKPTDVFHLLAMQHCVRRKNCCVISVVFCALVVSQIECAVVLSEEKRLIKLLLQKYEESGVTGRPVAHSNETMVVEYSLSLIQILDLDCKSQVLTINVWPTYSWTDPLLSWNPSHYSNVQNVRIPSNKIWTPDFVLYNYADKRLKEQRKASVVVDYNGRTTWMPQTIYKSSCKIDITKFPFDNQICHLKIGSWSYDASKMDIQFLLPNQSMSLDDYTVSNEWNIKAVPGRRFVRKYQCCPEEYADLTYFLFLERNPAFMAILLGLPCVLLSSLTLVIFWLPPENPAKMQLGMNIFVAFFLLLLLLADSTPSAASSVPYLGYYYCLNMGLITLSTFLSVIVLNLHFRGEQNRRMPNCLKRWTLIMGIILRIKQVRKCVELQPTSSKTVAEKNPFIAALVHRKPDPNARKFIKTNVDNLPAEMRKLTWRQYDRYTRLSMINRNYQRMLRSSVKVRTLLQEQIERLERRESREGQSKEWRMLACVLDRIFFTCYVVVIFLAAYVFLLPKREVMDVEQFIEDYYRANYQSKSVQTNV